MQDFSVHSQNVAESEQWSLLRPPRALTFRIEPGLKEVLRTAAEHEPRSIANTTAMVGMNMIDPTHTIAASPNPSQERRRQLASLIPEAFSES